MNALHVVKVGGRAQLDAALPDLLAAAWNAAPGALCVVHGGAVEIDRLQRALGGTPRFVGGRRVTSAEDVDTVRMALALANRRLVAALASRGVPAVGVSGEDARILEADVLDPALGRVGVPRRVDAGLLHVLLASGYLPVVAPLACAPEGAVGLNVNGDDAAAAIAAALGAAELLYVSDVDGVRRDGLTLESLGAEEAAAMIADGSAAGGMAVKLETALVALGAGTQRVRIGGVAAIADRTVGTTLTMHGGIAV